MLNSFDVKNVTVGKHTLTDSKWCLKKAVTEIIQACKLVLHSVSPLYQSLFLAHMYLHFLHKCITYFHILVKHLL